MSPFHDVNRPFLVARLRTLRATDGWTKLVWFKQGLKGAVAKVNRAFHNGLRPSEQPGAGVFDLLQVTQVRRLARMRARSLIWGDFRASPLNVLTVSRN